MFREEIEQFLKGYVEAGVCVQDNESSDQSIG
jgi:hypothetical protein